jgi:hypothetical protein
MQDGNQVLKIETQHCGDVTITGYPSGDWWHMTATPNQHKNDQVIYDVWNDTDDVLEFIAEHCPEAKAGFLKLLPEDDSRRVFAK